jgi:hypothetical protein
MKQLAHVLHTIPRMRGSDAALSYRVLPAVSPTPYQPQRAPGDDAASVVHDDAASR